MCTARQGLAALLVQGLSGCRPEEILGIPAEFISSMGLSQSLTPSRNNGFLNMFRLMQSRSKDLVDQVNPPPPPPPPPHNGRIRVFFPHLYLSLSCDGMPVWICNDHAAAQHTGSFPG